MHYHEALTEIEIRLEHRNRKELSRDVIASLKESLEIIKEEER